MGEGQGYWYVVERCLSDFGAGVCEGGGGMLNNEYRTDYIE